MTFVTNKNWDSTAHTATNQGAVKPRTTPIVDQKPSLFPIQTKYELVWQSLSTDYEGVPEETLITEIYRRPSKSEVQELKKHAFARGWFLASYSRKPYYPEGEEF